MPDAAAVGFLQAVELAAVALYPQAAAAVGSPAALAATTAFVSHHRAHAKAFAALAGGSAVRAAPAKLTAALAPASPLASERDALAYLHTLESRLAATQQSLLGGLVTVPAIALVAGTVPVECQHATLFGSLLSLPLADVVPVAQGTSGRLAPEDYPLP